MNFKDLIVIGLRKTGHDGLFNADHGCACSVNDIAPCGGIEDTCAAGRRFACDCPKIFGEKPHKFHIEE